MPKTNGSEQSSQSPPPNPNHQKFSDAIDTEQYIFLLDHATRTGTFSQAITLVLNILEANEAYRYNPNPSSAAALALSTTDCDVLKTFTIDAAALLAEQTLGETEWINSHTRTLRKARKAALEEAAQACAE